MLFKKIKMITYYFHGNFFKEIFYKFIIPILNFKNIFKIFSVINHYEYFVSINSINN